MRVGIVCDLQEERWPSMDLVASMLADHLRPPLSAGVEGVLLRPSMVRRLTRIPVLGGLKRSDLNDRIVNRFWDYRRWLVRFRNQFDVFHVVDHSYAHLVHVLPVSRTVVTCHDTDAFLSLVEPGVAESRLPRWLTRQVLTGMQAAAHIACDTHATADDLHRRRLAQPDRTSVVYNGVHPACSPAADEAADRFVAEAVFQASGNSNEMTTDLVHVGSTIPRKRIDILLRVVAAVREQRPSIRLLKAGGTFTREQRALIRELGLDGYVVTLPFLPPPALAALYRRATVVLLPSAREGFGLPIVEAMACGTPVIATDMPVTREVGGPAARYAGLNDIRQWRDSVLEVLLERQDPELSAARRHLCLEHSAHFRWQRHAQSMVDIYRDVCAVADREPIPRRSDSEPALAS